MTDIQKFDIIETANPVLTVAPIEEETEMLGATDKITALYCRLSVEDMKEGKNGEKADESNSIQTQEKICQGYLHPKILRSRIFVKTRATGLCPMTSARYFLFFHSHF